MNTKIKNGFSLIEIIFSLMITTIAALAFGSFTLLLSRVETKISQNMKLTDTKSILLVMLSDSRVWSQIVLGANSPYKLDKTKFINSELQCVRDKTTCVAGEYPLTILDQSGNIYFDSVQTNLGFKENGDPCSTYNGTSNNPNCPYQLQVKWKPICPATGVCIDPQVAITLKTVSTQGQSINASNFESSLIIDQQIETYMVVKNLTLYTNSFLAPGTHEVDFDTTKSVLSSSSNWNLSLDPSQKISNKGGQVSLSSSKTIHYIPPDNFFGLDSLNFKVTQLSNGKITTGTLYIKVMMPYTWTGLAGSSSLNSSQLSNFCGKVVNGSCDMISFPSTATGTSGNYIFDDTCTNCNGNIDNDSFSLEFSKAYSGTMKITSNIKTQSVLFKGGSLIQSGGDIQITGTQWLQSGGSFTGGKFDLRFMNESTLAITGGDFTAPENIYFGSHKDTALTFLTVTNASSFHHNNGNVSYVGNGSGGCNHKTWNISAPSLTLYDFTFNAQDSCWTKTGDAELTTDPGNKIVIEHRFNFAGGRLSANFDLLGDIYISNSARNSPGTLNITGNSIQKYNYSNNSGSGPNIVLNSTGSLVPDTGTTDLNIRSLNILSGTFKAPSGSLTLGTDSDIALEVLNVPQPNQFIHNNGTVVFYGSTLSSPLSPCGHKSWTINAPKINFYNLTFNALDSCATSTSDAELLTTAGSNIVVENILTLTAGQFNGTLDLQGNLSIETNSKNSSGTVTISGNKPQYYNAVNTGSGPNVVLKSSSSISPGKGTDSLNIRSLNIQSGSFWAPKGHLTLGTDSDIVMKVLSINDTSQFVHNNGTVIIYGAASNSCTQKLWTIDAPLISFNNLSININKSCLKSKTGELLISGNNTINILGDLTLDFGILNGGNINLSGNLIINAGFGSSSSDLGGSTSLTFLGNGSQDITVSGKMLTGNITIDKLTSTLNLKTDLSLSAPSQSLALIRGNINMNGNNLIISDSIGLDNQLTIGLGAVLTKKGGSLSYENLINNGGTIKP